MTPIVLLVGNPNTGKTSLFNALSGLRARTGNYPGITVDLRKATIKVGDANGTQSSPEIQLIDLPGLYALEPTSPEETIASEALQNAQLGEVAAVVVVADSTNLARHLVLANEILALGMPTIVALNMVDEAETAGIEIDLEALASEVQCPVVKTSARTRQGLQELKQKICELVFSKSVSLPIARPKCEVRCVGCTFAARYEWSESVVGKSVGGVKKPSPRVARIDQALTSPIVGTFSLIAVMLTVFFMIFSLAGVPMGLIEEGFGALADFASRLLPTEIASRALWVAIIAPISLAVCAFGYRLSDIRWTKTSGPMALGLTAVVVLLPPDEFKSLIIDGVIGGVAGVVVFLPQICILFFFITLLEDSGYMARGAFVMERIMRRVGLPGKAFVPMLTSHACAIPGIMATRVIENWRDRLVTILVLPLLTCSARLPVYAMIAALLYGDRPVMAALVFAGAYLLGIGAALLAALCLRKTIIPGKAAPLVMELPPYRIPSLQNATWTMVDRASVFLKNAGSVILLISVVLWAAATYPRLPASYSDDSSIAEADDSFVAENRLAQQALEYSIAGRVGKFVEPVFSPLGFDWKINVGVLSSFAAREVVVSTLSIVYGIGEEGAEDEAGLVETLRRQTKPDGSPVFTTATSFSLLVFYVLAMQCLPTQAVTRRETGSWKWAIFQLVYMTVLAYIAALAVYQLLAFLGMDA